MMDKEHGEVHVGSFQGLGLDGDIIFVDSLCSELNSIVHRTAGEVGKDSLAVAARGRGSFTPGLKSKVIFTYASSA